MGTSKLRVDVPEIVLDMVDFSRTEFFVNGVRMVPFVGESGVSVEDDSVILAEFPLGSEQNPAKNRDELPDGTGLVVNEFGDQHWFQNGEKHRVDGPAVEWANGDKEWWVNGKLHREDGPAVVEANGNKFWYQHGERHREDGPAVERKDCKSYYVNGQRHRTDGPAVEYSDGSTEYYVNGVLHREDGPAVIYVGSDGSVDKFWFENNVLHRADGPAVERANGIKEYWFHGEYMTEAEFLEAVLKNKKTDSKGDDNE